MQPKIGVLTKPLSRSSWVMAKFDEAGYRLGDVDRRIEEKYPAGRLELLALANLTHGQDKLAPLPRFRWPKLDLSQVDVVKCLPAWYLCLKARGVNYWVGLERSPLNVRDFETHEVLNTGNDFDPHEIWARANAYLSAHPEQHPNGHTAPKAHGSERQRETGAKVQRRKARGRL